MNDRVGRVEGCGSSTNVDYNYGVNGRNDEDYGYSKVKECRRNYECGVGYEDEDISEKGNYGNYGNYGKKNEPGGGSEYGGSSSMPIKTAPTLGMQSKLASPVDGATTIKEADVCDALKPWVNAINEASRITGVPAKLIAAMIYAESSGDPNTRSVNADGTIDWSLMQIGQERYDGDIKEKVGGPPLDVTNPVENILAGAYEIKLRIQQNVGDIRLGLEAYVGVNPSHNAEYAAMVLGNMQGDNLLNPRWLGQSPYPS
jgi:hypothetical protein